MRESRSAGNKENRQLKNGFEIKMSAQLKLERFEKRKLRVRKKISGTVERPRLNLRRSHLNLFVQAIDDVAERTLFSASTLSSKVRAMKRKQWGNVEAASSFGAWVAEELRKKQITRIVFDRGGRTYHGRVQAFAEALRKGGIQF